MFRIALALALLTTPLQAAEPSPADAYAACLIGYSVLEAMGGNRDAYAAAAVICADLAAAVPETYGDPEGEGGTGAAAVEETVVHWWDALIAPALPVIPDDQAILAPGYTPAPKDGMF